MGLAEEKEGMHSADNTIRQSNVPSVAPEESLRVLARLIGQRIMRERTLENIAKSRNNIGNNSDFSNVDIRGADR